VKVEVRQQKEVEVRQQKEVKVEVKQQQQQKEVHSAVERHPGSLSTASKSVQVNGAATVSTHPSLSSLTPLFFLLGP
jgi:hypothetical protein